MSHLIFVCFCSAPSICLYWVSPLVCSVSGQYAPEKVQKILVGNKSDEEQKRQVATEQGNKVNKYYFPPVHCIFHSYCYLLHIYSVMWQTLYLNLLFCSSLPRLMEWTFLRQVPLPATTLQRCNFVFFLLIYFLFLFKYLRNGEAMQPSDPFVCNFLLSTANQVFYLSFITVFHPIGWISLTS